MDNTAPKEKQILPLTDLAPSINSLDIARSHPNLYRIYVVLGALNLGLGLNLLFAVPSISPFQTPRYVIGGIFILLGVGQLVFLMYFHNLRNLRILSGIGIAMMFFLGSANLYTFLLGRTSLQTLVLYYGLCAIKIILIQEPPINTLTQTKGGTTK